MLARLDVEEVDPARGVADDDVVAAPAQVDGLAFPRGLLARAGLESAGRSRKRGEGGDGTLVRFGGLVRRTLALVPSRDRISCLPRACVAVLQVYTVGWLRWQVATLSQSRSLAVSRGGPRENRKRAGQEAGGKGTRREASQSCVTGFTKATLLPCVQVARDRVH